MYIRTKNGVYKIDEIKPYFLDEKQKLFINNELKIAVNEEQVIKQAENLEELCDEFVIEYHNGSKIISIHDNTDDFLREHKFEIKSGYIKNVYGAIWTDKGLIYVAKMNENGELELI